LGWRSSTLSAEELRRAREWEKTPPSEETQVLNTLGICMVCFEHGAVMHPGCDHHLCVDCWRQYLMMKVGEADVGSLQCAAPKCTVKVPLTMAHSLLPDTSWQRLQALLDDHHVLMQNTLSYCPDPKCGRVLSRTSANAQVVHCPCGGAWCPKCGGKPHWPARCQDVKDLKGLQTTHLPETKLCPGCSTMIEKNGGCSHMTCRQCSTHFCWMCGAHSKTGYPHYQGVPCVPASRINFSSLGLSHLEPQMHSLNLDALEERYQTAWQSCKSQAILQQAGLDLQIALILRNTSWRLQGLNDAEQMPAPLPRVMGQLLGTASLGVGEPTRRRTISKNIRRLRALLRTLFDLVQFDR